MKAQVSVEFSLLFLVSLVLVAMTVAAVQYMSSNYGKLLEDKKHRYDVDRLQVRAEEVCLSGVGSKREIILLTNVSQSEIKVDNCNVQITDGYGKVLLERKDGNVVAITHIG